MAIDFGALCEEWEDEYMKGDLSEPTDLHVLNRLSEIFPGEHRILGFAEHDVVGVSVDIDRFNEEVSEDVARDLHRHGLFWSYDYDCLCMFV